MVVVNIIVWSNEDQIDYPDDNDADVILGNLSEYTPNITAEYDSIMLIT